MRLFLFRIIGFTIGFSLLFSCSTDNHIRNIVLYEEYDIVTRSLRGGDATGFIWQVKPNANGHLISTGIRRPANHYIVYDLTEGRVIDSIDLNVKRFMDIEYALLIGKDSVLVALNSTYEFDCHDATFLLLSRNKRILDTIHPKGLPVQSLKNNMTGLSDRHYISFIECPIVYHSQKIFIPLLPWESDVAPPIGRVWTVSYPSNSHEGPKELPIRPSAPPKGHQWSYFDKSPYITSSGNAVYMFFHNQPILWRYVPKTNSIAKKKIHFQTIDEIKPYKNKENIKQYDAYQSRYEKLVYDSLNQIFYMTAKVRCGDSDGPLAVQRENYVYSFVILDERLNKIGEGIIPEGHQPIITPYKKGFLLPKKEGKFLTYTYFTYTIEKKDKNYLDKQIRHRRDSLNNLAPRQNRGKAFSAYLKKITGDYYDGYTSFVIISEASCPSCIPAFDKILSQNRQNIVERGTAIVMINSDKQAVENFCKEVDGELNPCSIRVSPGKIPVYGDTNNTFLYYFDYWVNLRYVAFDKLGNLVVDTLINPGNLNALNELLQSVSH